MLMTQVDWARRHGFSRQYVTQLIRKGVVRPVDGKIDPAQADAASPPSATRHAWNGGLDHPGKTRRRGRPV